MPECKTCHKEFEDYKKLALHLKFDHKSRSKWANAVLTDVQRLDRKVSFKPLERQPVTEQMKENRETCVREDISGRQKIAQTYCVNCQRSQRQAIPEELDNPFVWRIRDMIVITCENCSRKSRRF